MCRVKEREATVTKLKTATYVIKTKNNSCYPSIAVWLVFFYYY